MADKKEKKENKNKPSVFANNQDNEKTLHQNLDFTAKEQYKLIRTNLDFTLPETKPGMCPIIGVTSAMRGEGKSTTSINLAYAIAEKGSKVLLIDGDLRIPSIARKLGMENTAGLSDLLKGSGGQTYSFKPYLLENWYILPSGNIPPNPSELLGSSKMENVLTQLRKEFDYIIIDLPPVNLVSDAVSISKYISGMVVVVRQDYSEKREIEKCFRQLRLSNVNMLGVVMNRAKHDNGSYGKYRKYGKYYKYDSYYYSSSKDKK